ncbi:MAG TPA: holo-ACP synthase [Cyclobacteriaceae bacterium]|jgi:holo-[acyl-carrier protein] synthase|nr:holo-ACP synthase [Cyclobacteriaceae bacterium]
MIVGTGIDIIEVQRVADKVNKENGFREMVFSAAEILYCEKAVDKAEHYAARFAAKEAFLKAAGGGLTLGYELKDIEIVNDDLGKPSIQLNNKFEILASANGWKKIHVSLSHVQAMACAVVIIEQ